MCTRPHKILLLIPHLGGGGAEQVIALLVRGLSHDHYDLHLGLITQSDASGEFLPYWIHLHVLGASRVRRGAWRLLKLIRQLKPDLILSGMAHLNFLVLLLRPLFPHSTRVLVRQNGTVSAQLASGDLPVYTRLLYRLLYHRADRIICQSPAMAEDLITELALPRHRLAVLPNPVDVCAIRTTMLNSPPANLQVKTNSNTRGPHLLAVGRLAHEKGFDLLLQALDIVRKQYSNASLTIVGAGPQERALKALSDDFDLSTTVCFAGQIATPALYFSQSTLFVLSSRYEGLPNALLEAAAGGLPLVTMPSSQGIIDLVRGQPGVWLAEEVSAEALACSLLAALHSVQPGERFPHRWIEEFRLERAVEAYEQLIDTTFTEKSVGNSRTPWRQRSRNDN